MTYKEFSARRARVIEILSPHILLGAKDTEKIRLHRQLPGEDVARFHYGAGYVTEVTGDSVIMWTGYGQSYNIVPIEELSSITVHTKGGRQLQEYVL